MTQLDPWFVVMCSRHGHNCETGPCPGCSAESHDSGDRRRTMTRCAGCDGPGCVGPLSNGYERHCPCEGCSCPESHVQGGDDG